MNYFLKKCARSPHIIEVFLSYGICFLIQSVICLFHYQQSFTKWIALTCLGSMLYTFLEYWFHRTLLHEYLAKAHDNHHVKPRNLRIIATPIIPVQIYDFFVVSLLIFILGRDIAYGINCGICIGQMTMDTTHVLFHTRFCPWFLRPAKSYHAYHHFIDEEEAHGLTSSFWDSIFGTLPSSWRYYNNYPWIKYIQVPFPLFTFVVVGIVSGDFTKMFDKQSKLGIKLTSSSRSKINMDQKENKTVNHTNNNNNNNNNNVINNAGNNEIRYHKLGTPKNENVFIILFTTAIVISSWEYIICNLFG
eukprot:TRINITY_DN1285_c0_g1_i1.p1 TRINITY_DN1285_c0_g1~~TRINITY_DN1285_c0_g1_i1.p1  ORF type:complete len:304 (+),score=56.32 TRINITY_DN1285_c0_g1_i1:65-976(+)